MQNKHIFSESYTARKEAVLHALRREETAEAERNVHHPSLSPIRILAAVTILSALTVSVYAAVQWIEVHLEQDGSQIHFHAGLYDWAETNAAQTEKPKRSWNAEDGEISVRLLIPDLPADMHERENTNGKYYSSDTSRSMTVNGIDLRRSDLDAVIGGSTDVMQYDVGGKALYVMFSDSEAAFYNRTAFLVFDEAELVLKLWVSYGITEEELLSMTSTMTLEETDDALSALPISNETNNGSSATVTPIISEHAPVYETDLLAIGESQRAATDWYTACVDAVDVYDSISVLNPDYLLRRTFVSHFTDDSGALIPYNRTELIHTQEDCSVSTSFGESIPSAKKLYVVTLTVSDFRLDSLDDEDREDMIKACVNGFQLTNYITEDGEIELQYPSGVVIDRRPELRADTAESIYREYLGNNQWRVAYLVDETIAGEPLVLHEDTGKLFVKIQ